MFKSLGWEKFLQLLNVKGSARTDPSSLQDNFAFFCFTNHNYQTDTLRGLKTFIFI